MFDWYRAEPGMAFQTEPLYRGERLTFWFMAHNPFDPDYPIFGQNITPDGRKTIEPTLRCRHDLTRVPDLDLWELRERDRQAALHGCSRMDVSAPVVEQSKAVMRKAFRERCEQSPLGRPSLRSFSTHLMAWQGINALDIGEDEKAVYVQLIVGQVRKLWRDGEFSPRFPRVAGKRLRD